MYKNDTWIAYKKKGKKRKKKKKREEKKIIEKIMIKIFGAIISRYSNDAVLPFVRPKWESIGNL